MLPEASHKRHQVSMWGLVRLKNGVKTLFAKLTDPAGDVAQRYGEMKPNVVNPHDAGERSQLWIYCLPMSFGDKRMMDSPTATLTDLIFIWRFNVFTPL